MTVRESLLSVRQELIEKLRRADPATVAELERVDRALAVIDPSEVATEVADKEFDGLKIFEAARVYLSRVRHKVPKKDLAKKLIAGGVGSKGDRPSEWKINQSFAWHKSHGTLTLVDDLVGLPEWDKPIQKIDQKRPM